MEAVVTPPDTEVSQGEVIQIYLEALANCQHQAIVAGALVKKLQARLVERDERIAELEARLPASYKEAAE